MILTFFFIVRHGTNLLWAMNPIPRSGGKARIVAIEGEPSEWLVTKNLSVRHITTPHELWRFSGIGFHYQQKSVIWSESYTKRVQMLSLDGSTAPVTLYEGTSGIAVGLAVDWISNNVYFSDSLYNWITLLPMNSSTSGVYKRLIRTGLQHPHGLAVYPRKG